MEQDNPPDMLSAVREAVREDIADFMTAERGDVQSAVAAAVIMIEKDKAHLLNMVDAVIVVAVVVTVTLMIAFSLGAFAEAGVVASNCCTLGARLITKKVI